MIGTDQLVERLVAELVPVRRTLPPAQRLGLWLVISLPTLALIAWLMGIRPDLGTVLREPRFLAAQAAAFLTAGTAGYGALCAGLPDEPWWKLWVPPAAAGLWLATLGKQCWDLWATLGLSGLSLQQDAMCLPAIAVGAFVPAAAIVALLRRGTGVRLGASSLLGALAAAALSDVALRFYHPIDAALTVLVWQLGSVGLFTVIAGAIGRWVLLPHRNVPELHAGA